MLHGTLVVLQVPDIMIQNAADLVKMCKAILNFPGLSLSKKVQEQLTTAIAIPMSRAPLQGIGAARAATTDPKILMFIKKALDYVLDNVDPQNTNSEQPFGVLEGTWSKVSTTIEAMERSPEGSWLWVLDSDIVLMDMKVSMC